MTREKVRIEIEGPIAIVTIDNPKMNTLSTQVVRELDSAFVELRDMDEVRAAVLTGAGRAFVAGADINELNRLTQTEAMAYARAGQHMLLRVERLSKPVVAAVNGFALGGGCEVAMACAVRIASEAAKFGQPEVKLGLIPGFGGTQRLPRLVGIGRAMELLLTGDMIDAHEAYRIGLVNKVVAPEALLDEAKAMARRIAAVGPAAARFTLDAAYRGLNIAQSEGMRVEADLFGACFGTSDAKEGTSAFLEKREARFSGR